MLLRRHIVSLGIAVLTVVLGVYLYWIDSGRVSTDEASARKRNLLPAYRRADITEIVIQQKDEVIRIVQRDGDAGEPHYYLGEGELADQSAVDKMLGALEFATPERRIEGGLDRHEMGLDAPRIRLTVTMGALTFRLAVGADAPAPTGAAYAEVLGEGAGEGVVVIPRDLVTVLARPRDTYRSRTLVPYLTSSLAEMSIEGAGPPRRFSRGAWGGWSVGFSDHQVRVDRDVFERIVTSLADLSAEVFVSDSDADQILRGSSDNLHLTMSPREAGQPRAVLDLGGSCPQHPDDVVAVRSEPLPKKAACVPKGVKDALATPLTELTDRHLFSLRTDEMEQLSLVAGDKKLELLRAGTAWHMRAPSEGMVENEVGQGFARTLQDLVGDEILPDNPDAAGATRATVTITKTEGGDEPSGSETVLLAADAGDGFSYVLRTQDGVRLRLANDVARTLIPSGFSLRSRKIIDEPVADVQRLAIEEASVHQVLRRSSSGGWTLEEPSSLAVDPSLAIDVAEALCQLRADRWVADADDGSFGLATPRGSYQLDVEGGTLRIELGAATSGGSFARRVGVSGVFVLSQAVLRQLGTWAVDRSYFVVDVPEVRRVDLERAGEHTVLDASSRADGAPPGERWEIARSALSEMRAEGLVHVGAARKEEGFDKPLLTLTVVRAPAPSGPSTTMKMVVGRGDAWHDTNVFYARRDGIDATFAIAQSKLRPLLDLH